MNNTNSYQNYGIEINQEIDDLAELDRRLPIGDYYILQTDYSPPPRFHRTRFSRECFLVHAPDIIRNIFSFIIPLPSSVATRFAQLPFTEVQKPPRNK